MPRYFLNSLLVASATAVLGTAITSLAAYALSRFQFRGKVAYMTMLLATQMFPAALFLAPMYIVLRSYGLINSLWGLIVAYSTFVIPFCTWMLKGYFDGIPADLEEAAMVDGASRLSALRQIVLPLAAPGLATAILFAFLLGWQEFMFAIAFIQSGRVAHPSRRHRPHELGLRRLLHLPDGGSGDRHDPGRHPVRILAAVSDSRPDSRRCQRLTIRALERENVSVRFGEGGDLPRHGARLRHR